jgi:hypothetical protein
MVRLLEGKSIAFWPGIERNYPAKILVFACSFIIVAVILFGKEFLRGKG